MSFEFVKIRHMLLWLFFFSMSCYHFWYFLRLISVFGFQGTTLTVFISHSSVLLRLRTRNLWLLVLKSIQMLFASSSHIWKQAFICSSSRKTLEWRRRDSNSWPPACKAGALPTELRPHLGNLFNYPSLSAKWAWEDSNFRPHAYQACALTGWATSP